MGCTKHLCCECCPDCCKERYFTVTSVFSTILALSLVAFLCFSTLPEESSYLRPNVDDTYWTDESYEIRTHLIDYENDKYGIAHYDTFEEAVGSQSDGQLYVREEYIHLFMNIDNHLSMCQDPMVLKYRQENIHEIDTVTNLTEHLVSYVANLTQTSSGSNSSSTICVKSSLSTMDRDTEDIHVLIFLETAGIQYVIRALYEDSGLLFIGAEGISNSSILYDPNWVQQTLLYQADSVFLVTLDEDSTLSTHGFTNTLGDDESGIEFYYDISEVTYFGVFANQNFVSVYYQSSRFSTSQHSQVDNCVKAELIVLDVEIGVLSDPYRWHTPEDFFPYSGMYVY